MTLVDYLLYTVWFLFPLFYFLLALWSKLESISNRHKRGDTADLLRQGSLLLIVVIICVVIDQRWLASIVSIIPTDIVPLGFYRVMLFPVMLFLVAKILGPSKGIYIDKAPSLNKAKGKKR